MPFQTRDTTKIAITNTIIIITVILIIIYPLFIQYKSKRLSSCYYNLNDETNQ